MSLPPTNIPSSDLWAALVSMPRPFRLFDLPRKDLVTGEPVGQIAMQVLTQEEQMRCSAAAEKFTRDILKESPKADEARRGYDDLYNNAAAVEILFRACRVSTDIKRPFFPSPGELRKHLTIDEVAVLMSHYLTMQSEIGPIAASLSDEELDAWVVRLADGGVIYPLDLLSSEALKTLAFSLACRLRPYLTDTSSAGSPPEESTLSDMSAEA